MKILKNLLFSERRFCCWEYHLFKRCFHSIRLWAPDSFLRNSGGQSLLFFSNHHTWWDGFLEAPVIERYRLQPVFFIRTENNLGDTSNEFGENRAKGRAVSLNPSYFVYPHGQPLSNDGAWPAYNRQLAAFLGDSPLPALPMAKKIVHGRYARPEAFIEIGQPLKPESKENSKESNADRFEKVHRRLYEKLLRRIAKQDYSGAILPLPPRKASGKIQST